jgi:hypothetical protein
MKDLYQKLREMNEIPVDKRKSKGVLGIRVNITEAGETVIVETESGEKTFSTPESIINFINELAQ